MKKFLIKFIKPLLLKAINEAFDYLESEASLTTNPYDDKTVKWARQVVTTYVESL